MLAPNLPKHDWAHPSPNHTGHHRTSLDITRHHSTSLAIRLEDQPWIRLLVEGPDGALDAAVGDLAVVARQRRVGINVNYAFGDGAEGRHKMIGGFDDDNAALPRVDP